ncbi:hypothetical protein LO762_05385 [Actinocorallia sp. API 0066]|uniref:DUF6851 domain-containing protein n=1 Tax=Actinocorallia sp. API 0066 TaxID=2896846 RepID=UPI001E2B7AC6|nr:hypothetical protein [Actinocorallia sp. API 0066]MCD0448630.1 hypothetical protein [Actinocorallia sp. API 0066]
MFNRRLRRRHMGYAAAAVTAALMGSLTASVTASSREPVGFDLDNGNALIGVIYPRFDSVSRAESLGRPIPWTADHAMLVEMPWFDAIAPYHPTAVGIFSDLGRRPPAERTTRNKNIAVVYAAFTSLNAVLPQHKAAWREMMQAAGLDPDNTAEDRATPSGIGILAAKNALAARKADGSNRDGDANGRQYNQRPYADYTGYKPVNSAYELRSPSRWQPNTSSSRDVFTVQEFGFPQFGRLKPFSYRSPQQFQVPPPPNDHLLDAKGYRRQADGVLQASAGLDDRKKMTAELFNDNVRPFGAIAAQVVIGGGLSTEKAVQYVTTSIVAGYDVTVATWYYKRKYDSVRPFSAIRHLYGGRKITAWGGPGKGTVSDITGDEWQGYLSGLAAASPEYPSGVTAVCLAYTQQARRFTGSDKLEIFVPAPKGSSLVEPGRTPASDAPLRWSGLSDFAKDCGQSRVWGGENFPASVEAASRYASKIGDLSYEFVQRKLNGS